MLFSAEKLKTAFNECDIPAFFCDKELNIIETNKFIKDNDIAIIPGKNASDYFNGMIDCEEMKNITSETATYISSKFRFLKNQAILVAFSYNHRKYGDCILCIVHSLFDPYKTSFSSKDIVEVTHRFKNPITNIINISDSLARRFESTEDYVGLRYLNELIKNSHRLLRVSSSIDSYYSLASDTVVFHKEYINLNKFIENISLSLKLLLQNSDYDLNYTLPDETVFIYADNYFLSLTILNIVANSCTFSPKHSNIDISLTSDDNNAIITITDQGFGMSATVLAHAFEPFFTTKEPIGNGDDSHLGLGLPICKKIIEKHSGTILLSASENSPTSVMINIPITDPNDLKNTFVRSYTEQYSTNKSADIYTLFSDICDISFY